MSGATHTTLRGSSTAISFGTTDHFLSGSGGLQRPIQVGLWAWFSSQSALGLAEILNKIQMPVQGNKSSYGIPVNLNITNNNKVSQIPLETFLRGHNNYKYLINNTKKADVHVRLSPQNVSFSVIFNRCDGQRTYMK
jgi:hypothetical protein